MALPLISDWKLALRLVIVNRISQMTIDCAQFMEELLPIVLVSLHLLDKLLILTIDFEWKKVQLKNTWCPNLTQFVSTYTHT